jgi:hypothetical protein
MTADMRARLVLILTEYDRRQETKRGYNRWALGQYFRAIDEVDAAIVKGYPISRALKCGFCGPLLRYVAKKLGMDVKYERWE